MAKSLRVRIDSRNAVKGITKEIEDKAMNLIQGQLWESRKRAKADAKRNAPYDTGAHHNSIFSRSEKTRNGGRLTLGAGMHYSAYLEFGTGSGVSIPADFEELALEFKSGNSGHNNNMAARPHLIPALKKAFDEMSDYIEKRIGDI